MKKTVGILIGLVISVSIYSQTNLKVLVTPGKIAPRTEILIPLGENYLYEKYSYFKHVYWLEVQDTLFIENNTLKGSGVVVNLDNFIQEYDPCDPKINKIRNSALYFQERGKQDKVIREKIGYGNEEIKDFRRSIAISDEVIASTCYNEFLMMIADWGQHFDEKMEEIYLQKERRKEWIERNHDEINEEFITEFLNTFDENIADKSSFLEIVIANPKHLIAAMNKRENLYLIYWKLNDLPKSDKLLKAIEVLENSNLKGKVYRKIKKKLKKSERKQVVI